MAFKVSQNSLFAVLSRSPWWYSALIGLALIAISSLVFNAQYVALGVFSALPFFGIACYAGYRQFQQPGQKRVLEVDQQARKMSSAQLAEKIAESYRLARFDSKLVKNNVAELELARGHRKLLLCTRRFKAANTGIDPLKQLVAAGEKAEASGYLYVTLGDVSDAASDYAEQNDIELIQAGRLAAFFDGKVKIE
ncbi:MAG: restriction endonuclease [Granulosicoccus sp.]